MLLNYTDFQGQKTWLHYDTKWYVDRVTDARGAYDGDPDHSTYYTRGNASNSIGEITQIRASRHYHNQLRLLFEW